MPLPLPIEARPFFDDLRNENIGLNECRRMARYQWLMTRLDKIQSSSPEVLELRDILKELFRKDQW
jgi:hypothetical protein